MSSERLLTTNSSSEEERELLQRLLEEEGIEAAHPGIAPGNLPERLPLTYAQKRLWFLDRLQPGNDFYNVVLALELKGAIDVPALQRSLQEIVRRHGALRTRFVAEDDGPEQKIEPWVEFAVPVIDLRDTAEGSRRRRAHEMVADLGKEAFDLSQLPLLRGVLLKINEQEHLLGMSVHHIVFDDWSMGVLQHELQVLYGAYAQGEESPLREMPVQYADYTQWQQEWFKGKIFEQQQEYWRLQLAGMPPVLEITTDYPRPPLARYRGRIGARALPPQLWEQLNFMRLREGATMFMTLLAAYQTLLLRYTGQTDFGIGVPITNRSNVRAEGLIGYCLNTLVLRADLGRAPTFRELLARVRRTALEAYQHQDMPLERLVEELTPERDMSHTPLFQVMFSLIGSTVASIESAGLAINLVPIESGTSKCDLTLIVAETARPALIFNYDSDLFAPATIDRMLEHFERLLEGIVIDAAQPVCDLPMLGEAERQQMLVQWNRTEAAYPQRCVHELFEEQAARTPQAVAVEYEGRSLSYADLNRQANQLGHYLRKQGAGPEVRVGICLERSLEMVVGLLGILKAGGAYLPLDPSYPEERLAWVLEDSRVPLLLIQERFQGRFPRYAGKTVPLDGQWDEIAEESDRNLGSTSGLDNLVYVIYTSGSTGRPKGAMNVHGGLSNRLLWMQEFCRLDETDRILQKTPFTFDVSVWEFFWPLIVGARLVMARPGGQQDPDYLTETVRNCAITTLHFVPPMLSVWLEHKNAGSCSSLRRVICSGEALSVEVQKKFQRIFKAELHNLYGPTETSIEVTYWHCREDWTKDFVPIGRPIGNIQVYVLDETWQPVPVGVPGELYLAGAGLGRGYLERPELTAEKFIPNPFSERSGERLYRSGDRVRWQADGYLEFLGRLDHQVKVRGFRIELGEIESALQEQTGVRQAVVVVRGVGAGQRLVAYVAGEAGGEELRSYLKDRLPEYMVPAVFVKLTELPLNANGKVDRKALPEPEARTRGYRAPRTPQEEMLCEIFAQVLDLERVGIDDDFFSLGGHSLLATRLVSRVRSTLGAEIELRRVFEAPTVAELAHSLLHAGRARAPLMRSQRPARLPVSFAQRRLWFIDQIEKSSAEYNMPETLHLRGDLDVEALRRTVQTIVDRHESLRTHFAQWEGEPVQVIVPAMKVEVPLEDLSPLAPEEQQQRVRAAMAWEWETPFDLAQGPVLRLKLLKLGGQEHILLRTFHHIVSDGWSHGVFTREFMALYEAYQQGHKNPLPPLEVQYADYALWQRECFHEEALHRELDYWKKQLEGIPEKLEIATDRPRPAVQTFAAEACGIAFDGDTVAGLKHLGQSQHATLYMTLLAGFAVLLQRYSGQRDIVVGSPIANRQDERLEQLIGFFVNTLVMRVDVQPELSFAKLLASVRETALEAYRHQDLPFERLVEELSPERRLDRTPVFQVIFALQNAPMGRQQLQGLDVEAAGSDELQVRFDLEVHAFERGGRLEIFWVYNRDLFDARRMERMAVHYERLLRAASAAPALPVADLEILTGNERHQVLVEWNRTEIAFPPCCLHELFEKQAAQTPEGPAVIYGKDSLSYSELNQRANRLAHYLIRLGVGPEVPVGLYMERSLGMIVAMLGILKAGGAYLPIATDVPAARRGSMISGAGLRYMITTTADRPLFGGLVDHIVTLDGDSEELARQSTANPAVKHSPACLAYISYTSGSAGTPKGVLVTHTSIMRLVYAPNYAQFDNSTRMLQLAPLNFDASTFEIWNALLHGGSLVVMTAGKVSAQEIGEVIRDSGVNTMWLTAGLFREVVDHALNCLSGVGQLLTGGDVVPVDQAVRMLEAHPQCRLINGYGPTENCTFTCCYPVAGAAQIAQGVPIGFPINNTRVYVLDDGLKPAPVGVPGELYTSGAGLARGYMNRPDLTAERFLPNPYGVEPGERMYRTGDLVRWRADGALEFLGRNDHQVKIRGFRIELGEIESVLREHEAVQDSLVIVREQEGGKQLLGYVVPRPEAMEKDEVQGSYLVHWQQLYETTYRQGAATAGDFNVVGWNSSYTGGPIPPEEMRIWVDETVARIRALHPSRVLEIGCGTGLLLTRLAADCEGYLGLDLSAEVLAQLGQYLATRDELRHVVLRHGLAHEMSFLEDDSVDLVVLNSVVQYFPNVEYLLQVLAEAVRVTRRGGHIFVGDIRSLPLLEAFRTSVELSKADAATSMAELQRRVLQATHGEEELLINPELFTELARRWPKPGRAEAAVKTGAYDNELSRFRYDVILRLGDKETMVEPQRWLPWDEAGRWRNELEKLLAQQPGLPAGVLGVRDGRVAKAVEAAGLLHAGNPEITNAAQLQAAMAGVIGEDPNRVEEVAHRLGAQYCWRGFTSSGIYDIIFNPRWERAPAAEEMPAGHYHQYANAPAQVAEIAKLGRSLHSYLKQHLPEYMVPGAIMVLPAWPLTANGKIDRKALPAPQRHTESYRAPRTPQEEILCEMFAEVLGLERAGINDNFFDLGGHSLMATRLVSRVRAVLGIELELRTLFECPTVAQLAPRLDRVPVSRPPLVARPRPERLPLSYAQQRMWFIDRLKGASTEYNMCEALRLTGHLDLAALQRAIDAIVERHESLRAHLAEIDGTPAQVIEPLLDLALPVYDLGGLDEATRRERLEEAMRLERETPFDLLRGPLLRMKVLKLSEQEHVLLRTFHHIISDGWSHGIFNREFMVLYDAYQRGGEDPLPPLPVQYADYALWQREWLNDEVLNSHLEYWKKELAGIPEQLALPHDYPRPPIPTFAADLCRVVLPAQTLAALRQLSNDNQATLYMTLVSAFAVLLQRYSGENDIVVGSPIANRQDSQLEPLIGLFVNTLVVRVRVNPEESFEQLLQAVRRITLEAYAHQDLPFERLVEALSPRRSLNVTPVVQVVFALQNAPMGAQQLRSLVVEPVTADAHTVRMDLEVHVFEQEGEIGFYWLYKRDLFSRWRMEQMALHYARLLEAVLAGPEARLHMLGMLSEDERRQILVEWNDTARQFPDSESVQALFERQAAWTPEAPALIWGAESLTYRELNERTNQLAHYLRELGVGPEVRVAVCAIRGPQMLIAIVATVKAGGAYVPLDPKYPVERLNYMLEDSRARVLLTHTELLPRLSAFTGTVVRLDQQWNEIVTRPAANPPAVAALQNLAYVIYTSGSTGKPKAVAVCYDNLARLVHCSLELFTPQDLRGILCATSICFDVAAFEIFVPLACGGSVCMAENALELPNMPHADKVSMIAAVPSTIRELLLMNGIPPSVRIINLGGEAFNAALVRDVYAQTSVEKVFNLYGPSEDTVYSTYFSLPRSYDAVPLIGRPVANTQAYVLDAWLQPVPMGVAGELYLAGEGQARGYLYRPDLTAERFLPDPFAQKPGGRLYRTGDLARWSPDGNLDFAGRADDQVKIRGFRIELGEIESVLQENPEVEQVVVVALENAANEKQLAAYIVTRDRKEGSPAALRDYLKDRLPEYMTPTHFIFLERFPLTSTGKVNRQALPRPESNTANLYVAPGTETEKLLAEVWKQALAVERVGLDDNFFDLGGHSLLVARIRFALSQRLKKDVAMVDFFTSPTVRTLARRLEGLEEKAASVANQRSSPLVPIRAQGANPPLFLVHPAGGGVVAYHGLARYLRSEQPVYALQNHEIGGDEEHVDATIEQMAARYVDAIQTVQAHGPYMVGGASLGGTLAMEMAQQLVGRSEQVLLVAMLDTHAQVRPRMQGQPAHETLAIDLLLYASVIASGQGREFEAPVSGLENMDAQSQIAYIFQKLREYDLVPASLSSSAFRAALMTFRRNVDALERYRPRTYKGRVLLLRASEVPEVVKQSAGAIYDDPAYGWQAYCTQPLRVEWVPGDHESMNLEPNVRVVGAVLQRYIDETLGAGN